MNNNILQSLNIDKQAFFSNQQITFNQVNLNGEEKIFASHYMPEVGWFVVVQLDADEVFADSQALFVKLMTISLVVSALFIALTIWLVSTIIKPLNTLGTMLQDIAHGDGDLTKRLDDTRDDELGRLAKSYNTFVESLSVMLLQVNQSPGP
ncbi:HAMP domain-containing protein [Vibrio diabolicus]|uniref:Methyl-accepting chemotaxis protein n=1 Tax=Vibrio diabolicus TaxID=50719 RepID=A0AA92R552_9VIBR|nr:methyl-accepting chemotaxis protein [Vibrio diabolicus]QRG81518.1 methyl-accepting chemotaxis protein [Vibrio diabolicus]